MFFNRKIVQTLSFTIVFTGALGTGCPGENAADAGAGTDAGEEEHDHDVEEELCEHMAEGPAVEVTAGSDLSGAPDVSTEHTRHDITLLAEEGDDTYGGSVAFAADEAGEFFVALNTDVAVAFFTSGGDAIAIEETEEGSELCTEVGIIHVIDLEVGTAELRFSGATEEVVQVVIEHGGEHEDE